MSRNIIFVLHVTDLISLLSFNTKKAGLVYQSILSEFHVSISVNEPRTKFLILMKLDTNVKTHQFLALSITIRQMYKRLRWMLC
jgi:hypothetical protein